VTAIFVTVQLVGQEEPRATRRDVAQQTSDRSCTKTLRA